MPGKARSAAATKVPVDEPRDAVPSGDAAYARDLELSYLIHDVSRLRRLTFDQLMKPLGATRAQWWVIAFLARRDGMRQTNLAFELDIGKASLGTLIDRLEAAGWVERRPDPIDRRAKRVYLSAKSRRFAREMGNVDRAFNREMLKNFGEEDRDTLVRLLSRLKQALQRLDGERLRRRRRP